MTNFLVKKDSLKFYESEQGKTETAHSQLTVVMFSSIQDAKFVFPRSDEEGLQVFVCQSLMRRVN